MRTIAAAWVVACSLGLAAIACKEPATGADVHRGDSDVHASGIETSQLTPRERHEWTTYMSEFLAPCEKVAVTLNQCLSEQRACGDCTAAAQFLLARVKDGMTREQIEQKYKNRFDPAGIIDIPIDGSPSKGPENARITITEFADFECPACQRVAPGIEKTIAAHSDVKFVYKFLPLPIHPHAEQAARAAIAAGNQGKFWPMHKVLFDNGSRLEMNDLEQYAKELGLDLARFRSDMQSPATTERLAKDRALADKIKVRGTPSIYINGREFDFHSDMNEWLAAESGRTK